MTEYVLRQAESQATRPALIDGPSGRTLTYGQLAGAIRLAAAGLAARGFQKGDVFGIYSPNLPEYAIAFHADRRPAVLPHLWHDAHFEHGAGRRLPGGDDAPF